MSIKAELASIVERLEAIEKIFAEYRDSMRAQQERERQLDGSSRLIRSQIAFDDATKADNKTEADRQYRVQNAIRWSAFAAFCAALIYAGIALVQWNEMHTQTQEIFRQAEVENNDAGVRAVQWLAQFKIAQDQSNAAQNSVKAVQQQVQQDRRALNETISEMKKQTSSMQDEANATLQQGEISRSQAGARLRFVHPNWIRSPDGAARITFDLVNEGDSEATEIGEESSDGPAAPNPSRDEQLVAEGRINPTGDTLEKGASKHILIEVSKIPPPNPANGDFAWYAYRKYTYLDIFQQTKVACILVFEHKERFYFNACPPQQNNPN